MTSIFSAGHPVTEPIAPDQGRGFAFSWKGVEHLGTALTVGYLVLVAVGMLHTFLRYWGFGINVLDFADPSDFILAPLRDPLVIAATVVPAAVVGMVLDRSNRAGLKIRARRREAGKPIAWWETKEENFAQMLRASRLIKYFAVATWVVVGSLSYQRLVADRIMLGNGLRVTVETTAGDREAGTDRRPVMLIGTTARYVFLFRTEDWRTVVLPAENVLRITPTRLARGAQRMRPRFIRAMDSAGPAGDQ